MDRVHRFLILAAIATLGGCAFWQPDWTIPAPRRPASDLAALVARAEELSGRAGDRADLEEAMDAWRVVLSADSSHYAALTQLGNQQILFGAAHARTASEQQAAYREAMTLTARAMATNPGFRSQVEGGTPLWNAVDQLGPA
ncbi:MAG: hypothetical protein HY900_22725, partial [Deltaproteobacteria bacterium]|nr:hypothetical protein [Deltaproteobacteria bacterium]